MSARLPPLLACLALCACSGAAPVLIAPLDQDAGQNPGTGSAPDAPAGPDVAPDAADVDAGADGSGGALDSAEELAADVVLDVGPVDAPIDVASLPRPPTTTQGLGRGCAPLGPPPQCPFDFLDDAAAWVTWPLVCFGYAVPMDGYNMAGTCSLACTSPANRADCLAAGWHCVKVPGFGGAPEYCVP